MNFKLLSLESENQNEGEWPIFTSILNSKFVKPRPVWVAIGRKIKTELQRLIYSGKGPNI